jgi:hypothetical protein
MANRDGFEGKGRCSTGPLNACFSTGKQMRNKAYFTFAFQLFDGVLPNENKYSTNFPSTASLLGRLQ